MKEFTEYDWELIAEALTKAASRHESEARFNPTSDSTATHEEKAADMRKLRSRILKSALATVWALALFAAVATATYSAHAGQQCCAQGNNGTWRCWNC